MFKSTLFRTVSCQVGLFFMLYLFGRGSMGCSGENRQSVGSHARGSMCDLCASGGGGTAEPPGGADAGDAFEAAVCPVPLGSTGP